MYRDIRNFQRALLATVALFFVFSSPVAGEIVYTVGGEKKEGQKVARAGGGKWFENLQEALNYTALSINKNRAVKVVIKVAGGNHLAGGRHGVFEMPALRNSQGTLVIKGGYSGDFGKRRPYYHPTRLVPGPRRTGGVIQFPYSNHKKIQYELATLVFDGLLFDGAPSNVYSRTGSLLSGRSRDEKAISFKYFKVENLDIRHCIFINFPHRTLCPLLRVASNESRIRLYNCLFYNCLIPLKVDVARYRYRPALWEIDRCSFVFNWPLNYDPTTGNPAALEIGPAYAMGKVKITNNLFYANPGGAIFLLFKKWPTLVVENNNFVGNGLLFGEMGKEAGVLTYFEGGNRRRLTLDQSRKFGGVYQWKGNVSLRPKVPASLDGKGSFKVREVTGEKSWEDELARLLGSYFQGGRVKVKVFAPKRDYLPQRPPFPLRKGAKKYGVSPQLAQ